MDFHLLKSVHQHFFLFSLPLIVLLGTVVGCSQAINDVSTAVAINTPISNNNALAKTTAIPPTNTAIPTNTAVPPTATSIPTASATAVATTTAVPTVATTNVQATAVSFAPSDPLPTPQGVYSWTLKVPILMYHYISHPPDDADKYRKDLSVSPEDFRAQMDYLVENGYETIDLYDLSQAIAAKQDLPDKPVVISLDDGYRDNYENAFPILKEYGLQATFFVVTEFIDKGFDDYITWDMVTEMSAAGMRIEPHSKTHPDLSGQDRDYIIYEILGSQETIAAHIGYTPRYFCYPGGRYDDTTLEVVAELDFWGAVTTAGGQWHGFNDRFEWPRMRMRNTTALLEFADFVNPGETVAGKTIGS